MSNCILPKFSKDIPNPLWNFFNLDFEGYSVTVEYHSSLDKVTKTCINVGDSLKDLQDPAVSTRIFSEIIFNAYEFLLSLNDVPKEQENKTYDTWQEALADFKIRNGEFRLQGQDFIRSWYLNWNLGTSGNLFDAYDQELTDYDPDLENAGLQEAPAEDWQFDVSNVVETVSDPEPEEPDYVFEESSPLDFDETVPNATTTINEEDDVLGRYF